MAEQFPKEVVPSDYTTGAHIVRGGGGAGKITVTLLIWRTCGGKQRHIYTYIYIYIYTSIHIQTLPRENYNPAGTDN